MKSWLTMDGKINEFEQVHQKPISHPARVRAFSACADGHDHQLVKNLFSCRQDQESGFWFGLLNGMTAGIAFLYSLFDDSVSHYDVCNNGGFYWFGYLLGIGAFASSSSSAASK